MSESKIRWDVRLTKDGTDGGGLNRVDTFTWADTRPQAVARVADMVDREDWWEGWSFEVAEAPNTPLPTSPNVVNRGAW